MANKTRAHSLSTLRFLGIARCPICKIGSLNYNHEVATCVSCNAWYPVINGILELVPGYSAYSDDRRTFWKKLGKKYRLTKQKHYPPAPAQKLQRRHFDWYASNGIQSYNAYEKMAFWKATDKIIIQNWMSLIPTDAIVFDIGCAQGRSTAPFVHNKHTVIGCDISKNMIETGIRRFSTSPSRPYLFVGDATAIPVRDKSIDAVVVYGVLHHLPHPAKVAKEISRILKPGGIVLSLENNKTPLRFLFDILQHTFRLWHEEAGESPTMSHYDIRKWFSNANIQVTTKTHVFVPPHFINLMSVTVAERVLRWTDMIASKIPVINKWGGLIEITGIKEV